MKILYYILQRRSDGKFYGSGNTWVDFWQATPFASEAHALGFIIGQWGENCDVDYCEITTACDETTVFE